jgi:hypothetical protein
MVTDNLSNASLACQGSPVIMGFRKLGFRRSAAVYCSIASSSSLSPGHPPGAGARPGIGRAGPGRGNIMTDSLCPGNKSNTNNFRKGVRRCKGDAQSGVEEL